MFRSFARDTRGYEGQFVVPADLRSRQCLDVNLFCASRRPSRKQLRNLNLESFGNRTEGVQWGMLPTTLYVRQGRSRHPDQCS